MPWASVSSSTRVLKAGNVSLPAMRDSAMAALAPQVGGLLAVDGDVARLGDLHERGHGAPVARKIKRVGRAGSLSRIGLAVLEHVEDGVDGRGRRDVAERDEGRPMLVALGLDVQTRHQGGHGLLGAKVAEQDGRLVRHDTRRELVELQLPRHGLDVSVLLLQELDERIDGRRADAHEGQAALLKNLRPTPCHEQALQERGDGLRVAQLGQAQGGLLVQQEVLVVGGGREDLHERRHSAFVTDLDEGPQGRDARAVGARLDRQRLLDGLDERLDGVGGLHVGQHACGDRRAVEVVVGVVEGRDHEGLRSLVLVAGEGLEVLGPLRVLVERDQGRHGGACPFDVHVGEVVEGFLLRAQVRQLLGPRHGIVGIAGAREVSDGERGGDRKSERLSAHRDPPMTEKR